MSVVERADDSTEDEELGNESAHATSVKSSRSGRRNSGVGRTSSNSSRVTRTNSTGSKGVQRTTSNTSKSQPLEQDPEKRNSYELPPASLPKKKPQHMSYAESRISKIRGQHAQYIADRKSKSGDTNGSQ